MKKLTFKQKMIYGGIILLVVYIVFMSIAVSNSKSGKVYQIEYFDFGNTHMYMTDTIYSQNDRCVEFRDIILNSRKKVCSQNIVVTQFQ